MVQSHAEETNVAEKVKIEFDIPTFNFCRSEPGFNLFPIQFSGPHQRIRTAPVQASPYQESSSLRIESKAYWEYCSRAAKKSSWETFALPRLIALLTAAFTKWIRSRGRGSTVRNMNVGQSYTNNFGREQIIPYIRSDALPRCTIEHPFFQNPKQ